MTVVHPGDHVVIAFPGTSGTDAEAARLEKCIRELGDSMPDGVSMTWSPVAPPGTAPYVLCVIRPRW